MDYTLITLAGETIDVPESDVSPTSMEDAGYCRACGARTSGVEPDAREYACDRCDEAEVYGAQELLMMGEIQ